MSDKKKKKDNKGRTTRIYRYKAPDGILYTLTAQQKRFCDYFLTFKGNGVDAVYEAGYSPKNALVAAAISSENLTKPNIYNYINIKLEQYGFNDDSVMKQHLFLLNQQADFKSKAKAIDMFYKVRGKYAPQKIDITEDIDGLPEDELDRRIAEKEHLLKRYRSAKKETTKVSSKEKQVP